MSARELLVLSLNRLSTRHSMTYATDEVAALLNGYVALWHPAALRGAGGPPKVASPYDHDQPSAEHLYAAVEAPSLLPDDWDLRVAGVNGLTFRATTDRAPTLANMLDALRPTAPVPHLLDLTAEQLAPFFGIGFGYLMVETLFEAMEHENLLPVAELWQDVQQAAATFEAGGDPAEQAAACRRHLQAAADKLQAAREVLYPNNVPIIDILYLDEQRLGDPLPAAYAHGQPLNLVAAGAVLEKLSQERPELAAALRERFQEGKVEMCGGPYLEREDAVMPIDSQLWNLLKGLSVSKEILGAEIRVYARKRYAAGPQLPLLLSTCGLHLALFPPIENSSVPSYPSVITTWQAPDGKQIEAFTRAPYRADDPNTFFNLAYYLRQTIMQDQVAALALVHGDKPAGPWYEDWLHLQSFGPILGVWTPLARVFGGGMGGYSSTPSTDEFHSDYLEERTNAHSDQPVSQFAKQLRLRRRVDTAWTMAGLYRGLGPTPDAATQEPALEKRLLELEDQVEVGQVQNLPAIEREVAERLAHRLVARATGNQAGFLVLNPCSFARRVVLDLDDVPGPLPLTGPLKAGQFADGKARLVVEVPALGFAWFPRQGPPGTPHPTSKIKLADKTMLRNEFFEAEVDQQTGGLRAIRDHRTRINRVGQQLVFNPGSKPRVKEIKVTSAGPALGEIVSEGALLDEHDQVLATFRQRFRAWLGRPLLEMRIEIFPENPPTGYPWHAYYGARFAWRDERSLLLRGVNGTGYITSHTRPETPDYLELRQGRQGTVIFPGGLPFHQRHGSRMLDAILLVEGETARSFDLALGLDREQPMQTALGLSSPVTVVPTEKGPPPIGATGWLFHLDSPNLLLSSLRPAPGGADALIARLLEVTSCTVQSELRCVRDPQRAQIQDARGTFTLQAMTRGDVVDFEVSPCDLAHLLIDFSPGTD